MREKTEQSGTKFSRESFISWTTDIFAAAYLLWMGYSLRAGTANLGHLYEGLGADLPVFTRFLVQQGGWFYPLVFGFFTLIVFAKEFVIRDKRISTMVTFLLAILGQFVWHWMTTLFFYPMVELIQQIG